VTAIDKYIRLRLRTRRLTLHMTQTDLANVIGVTFQQLQKYEKGTNRITASTLQKLAAAMKVPITYFSKTLHASMLTKTTQRWHGPVASHSGWLGALQSFQRNRKQVSPSRRGQSCRRDREGANNHFTGRVIMRSTGNG
jgi:transcriptional regulator with XRE-family HTH domain